MGAQFLGTDPRINAANGALISMDRTALLANQIDRGIRKLQIQNAVTSGSISPETAQQMYQTLGNGFLQDSRNLQQSFKQGAAQGADLNYLLSKINSGGNNQ